MIKIMIPFSICLLLLQYRRISHNLLISRNMTTFEMELNKIITPFHPSEHLGTVQSSIVQVFAWPKTFRHILSDIRSSICNVVVKKLSVSYEIILFRISQMDERNKWKGTTKHRRCRTIVNSHNQRKYLTRRNSGWFVSFNKRKSWTVRIPCEESCSWNLPSFRIFSKRHTSSCKLGG